MVMASEILDDWERKVLHHMLHAYQIVPNNMDWLRRVVAEDTQGAPDQVQEAVKVMLTKLEALPWSDVNDLLMFCVNET